MSYDIPDEIKYKEKIVFGLDFKQLGYVCLFGLLAFIFFNLPIQGDLKLVLPTIFLIYGIGFAFLNLEEKLLDYKAFYLGVRDAKASDAKAQDFIGIRKVNDNVVFLKYGGLRTVVKVEPVNFSLLDESQRKALILNYREFLNHLTSPIQILVKTTEPDLNEYFVRAQNRLEKAPDQLKTLLEDFLEFEQNFLSTNHVRERNFYLIVAHETQKTLLQNANDDQQLELLEQKTKIIQEKLLACGLNSTRLENEELTDLLTQYSSQEANKHKEKLNNERKNEAPEAGRPKRRKRKKQR